jgi:hypothetical protein
MVSSTSRTTKLRLRLALASAAVACLAVVPASALGATRYASPTGTGATPCVESEPCSIETALNRDEGLENGDTVLLAPGTYTPSGELAPLRLNITIEGEPGEPMPLIEAAGTRGLFLQNVGTVRDLRIHSTLFTTYGLVLNREGSVVERVESTGEAGVACAFGEVTVKSALCVTSATGGVGVLSSLSGVGVREEPQLYNVTAIGAVGIEAIANESAQVRIEAFNTIARGSEYDIFANSEEPPNSEAEITISHSNFANAGVAGNGETSAPTANGNQSAAPLFVDEVGSDFRETPGSPTVNAGATTYPVGPFDLAGAPRTITCEGTAYVDIGAYELGECPPPKEPEKPATGGGDTGGGTTTPILGEGRMPEPVAPKLTKLALTPSSFAVIGEKKGTTISFSLSESATVKLEVLGKKAVKGKKPKTVTLGTLPVVHGKSGANKVKFAGKLKGKPLAAGKYTLRAVATSGGRHSAPQIKPFQVLAPAT